MSDGTQRPTAVLVLGIISIALGILGICGGLINLVSNVIGFRSNLAANIPPDAELWLRIVQGISLGLHLALLVSGIGLILMKNWARILSMIYAGLDIPTSIAQTIFSTQVILPIVEKSAPANMPPEAMKIAMAASIGGGVCCGLIYPVVLLVVLNLKSVRAAFVPGAGAPPEITQSV